MEKLSNSIKNTQDTIKNVSVKNPITGDSAILSYYTNPAKYNEEEVFDKQYAIALQLMGGDRLLKPASSINSVSIRKTTTKGLYKLILNNPELKFKVRHIDEGKLINDRQYCKGTLSKLDEDTYEITYFDDDEEIVIEHLNKQDTIKFMNEHRLIFQM